MNSLELYSFIIPISLITFIIDYLSDSQIINSETRIGLIEYFHHLISILCTIGLPICAFFNRSIPLLSINIIVFLVAQSGWLYNNDNCFLINSVNILIDPQKPNRIWRSDIQSFIKHYIRGDDWAYKDIFNNNKTELVLYVNSMLLINILLLMYK